MFRKTSVKQTNALETQARQPNKQMVLADARFPRSKNKFRQQWQQRQTQRRVKNDLTDSTYESRENLDSFSLSMLSEISQTDYVRLSKFEREILQISCRLVRVLSIIQKVAFSRCCFVAFCQQRNEQRIVKHACTAIDIVAVAAKVQLKCN